MQTINKKELSNFRVNKIGGIDADWNNNGERIPYSLTSEESNQVIGNVEPFDADARAQQEQINQFKANRQQLLDNAIVTTSLGNQYDADEQSISRMANAILAAQRRGINDIKWSLADTPTGVMTDVTLADLEEAHELAVENMANIWSV